MKWWNRKGLTPRQSGLLPTFFTLLSPIPRLPLLRRKKKEKKKVRVLPHPSPSWISGHIHKNMTSDRAKTNQKQTIIIKHRGRKSNLWSVVFKDTVSGFSRQCSALLLFDPKQLLGVGMHYLNDPLCFSQSGGCRRLINFTCLLFRTQWGQTHIAYSKPALRQPFHPPQFPVSFLQPLSKHTHFSSTIRLSYK